MKYAAVSANYFDVLDATITRGRAFTDAESRGGEPVALINEAFANRFFSGVDPIDRFIRPGGADALDHRVVGVTSNAVISRIGEPAEPYFYIPYWRARTGEGTLIIRPTTDANALGPDVRAALRDVDPRLDPEARDHHAAVHRVFVRFLPDDGGPGDDAGRDWPAAHDARASTA